jgi:hypothetical protein
MRLPLRELLAGRMERRRSVFENSAIGVASVLLLDLKLLPLLFQ